jgi:hypothetical protein
VAVTIFYFGVLEYNGQSFPPERNGCWNLRRAAPKEVFRILRSTLFRALTAKLGSLIETGTFVLAVRRIHRSPAKLSLAKTVTSEMRNPANRIVNMNA